jgi:hypothetical protein
MQTSENDNLAVGEWLPLDCLSSKEMKHFSACLWSLLALVRGPRD